MVDLRMGGVGAFSPFTRAAHTYGRMDGYAWGGWVGGGGVFSFPPPDTQGAYGRTDSHARTHQHEEREDREAAEERGPEDAVLFIRSSMGVGVVVGGGKGCQTHTDGSIDRPWSQNKHLPPPP